MRSVDKDCKFNFVLNNSPGNCCAKKLYVIYNIYIYINIYLLYVHMYISIYCICMYVYIYIRNDFIQLPCGKKGSCRLPGRFPSLCGGRKWQAIGRCRSIG